MCYFNFCATCKNKLKQLIVVSGGKRNFLHVSDVKPFFNFFLFSLQCHVNSFMLVLFFKFLAYLNLSPPFMLHCVIQKAVKPPRLLAAIFILTAVLCSCRERLNAFIRPQRSLKIIFLHVSKQGRQIHKYLNIDVHKPVIARKKTPLGQIHM